MNHIIGYLVIKKNDKDIRGACSYKMIWRFRKNAEDEKKELESRFHEKYIIKKVFIVIE